MDRKKLSSGLLRKRYLSTGQFLPSCLASPAMTPKGDSRQKGTSLRKFHPPKQMLQKQSADSTLQTLSQTKCSALEEFRWNRSTRTTFRAFQCTNIESQQHQNTSKAGLEPDTSKNIESLTLEINFLRSQVAETFDRLIIQQRNRKCLHETTRPDPRQIAALKHREAIEEHQKEKLCILKQIKRQRQKKKELRMSIQQETNCLVTAIEHRRTLKDPLKFVRRLTKNIREVWASS